jgi:hypothetical protein
MSTTYSFLDLKGSFTTPVAPPFIFAGQIGLDKITIRMVTEQTQQDVASDGNIMISAIAGDNAIVEIEMQQTCDLHAYLLGVFNILKTQKLSGNVQNWAANAIYLQNLTDLSIHEITGVSFGKLPDKPYAAQGQHLIWQLYGADSQQLTL